MKFDPIGMFKGKNISTMDKDELLDFARWAMLEIEFLKGHYDLSQSDRIHKEVVLNLKPKRSMFSLWKVGNLW